MMGLFGQNDLSSLWAPLGPCGLGPYGPGPYGAPPEIHRISLNLMNYIDFQWNWINIKSVRVLSNLPGGGPESSCVNGCRVFGSDCVLASSLTASALDILLDANDAGGSPTHVHIYICTCVGDPPASLASNSMSRAEAVRLEARTQSEPNTRQPLTHDDSGPPPGKLDKTLTDFIFIQFH